MKEFVEFLGAQSPYDRLDGDDLARLAANVEIEFFNQGSVIIEQESPVLEYIRIVRTGAVEVIDRGRVIDVLGPGDSFGHISVLSGLAPSMVIRAAEDTLCYRVPDPRLIVEHPEVLQFHHYGVVIARQRLIESGGSITRLQRPIREIMRPITWCRADESIRTVAARITAEGASSGVFLSPSGPGIVTDNDFRKHVATGSVGVDAPVATIASTPAFVIAADLAASTAFLTMVERGVHHLVVVDGNNVPVGVARVVDIAAADIRDPLMVRAATAAAGNLSELITAAKLLAPTTVDLWDTGIPAEHLGGLMSTMIEAIVDKAIQLGSDELADVPIDCSWLMLGSLGRREPLPNSDIDTALIWQVRPDADVSSHEIAAAVGPIMDVLARCGLRPCPQGLNASNLAFNRSLTNWLTVVEQWKYAPSTPEYLLHASTMLDSRALTLGHLAQPVRAALVTDSSMAEYSKSMMAFALSSRPPVGFVREFVIEHFGEQKGYLNLKKAGLRPIASLARALSIRTGDASGTTPERLDRAHHAGLLSEGEVDVLKGAFSLFYQLASDSQIRSIRIGTPVEPVIEPRKLDEMERRHLRMAFRAVAQVQDVLRASPFRQASRV